MPSIKPPTTDQTQGKPVKSQSARLLKLILIPVIIFAALIAAVIVFSVIRNVSETMGKFTSQQQVDDTTAAVKEKYGIVTLLGASATSTIIPNGDVLTGSRILATGTLHYETPVTVDELNTAITSSLPVPESFGTNGALWEISNDSTDIPARTVQPTDGDGVTAQDLPYGRLVAAGGGYSSDIWSYKIVYDLQKTQTFRPCQETEKCTRAMTDAITRYQLHDALVTDVHYKIGMKFLDKK